jgi:hypothetical protein
MANSGIPIGTPEVTSERLATQRIQRPDPQNSNTLTNYEREELVIAGTAPEEIVVPTDTDPDGSAFALPVRPIDSLGPVVEALVATNLAAGAAADLDGALINLGFTGKLLAVTCAGSLPGKFEIKTVVGATVVTRDVVMTGGLLAGCPSERWSTPARDFIALLGNGSNNFRVTVTNLDAQHAADFYVSFYWDEVP